MGGDQAGPAVPPAAHGAYRRPWEPRQLPRDDPRGPPDDPARPVRPWRVHVRPRPRGGPGPRDDRDGPRAPRRETAGPPRTNRERARVPRDGAGDRPSRVQPPRPRGGRRELSLPVPDRASLGGGRR